MELTVIDWIIFAVTAFFTVVGLFKGFSGQLGSLVGMAMALVNYPIYKGILESRKKKYSVEILELSEKIINH